MGAEKTSRFPPVYEHSIQKAAERGELEQFRNSGKLNVECAKAIDTALAKYFSDDTYEFEYKLYAAAACRDVVEKFGFDRPMAVLANTVRHFSWDGRFSQASREWARERSIPHLGGGEIDRSCLVSANAALTEQLIDQIRYDYLLPQPLKETEIRAEAEQVLKRLQDLPAPNDPDKENFLAPVSKIFNDRAKPEDFARMLKLLPFNDPKLTLQYGHKGFFVVIKSDEVRRQPLRKPSVLAKLAAKPVPGNKPVGKKHDREATL